MGDLCDMSDIDRFIRSKAGKAYLDEIVAILKGRTIVNVDFSNEVHCIATTLHLDDGNSFVMFQPSFDVDALREEFAETIEEEYYKDYPERTPDASQPTNRQAKETKRSRLIPLTKWNEYHEWPPIGGLRHLVFHAKSNGFDKVMRKVGSRVLIDEDAFFEWTKTESETGKGFTLNRSTPTCGLRPGGHRRSSKKATKEDRS